MYASLIIKNQKLYKQAVYTALRDYCEKRFETANKVNEAVKKLNKSSKARCLLELKTYAVES